MRKSMDDGAGSGGAAPHFDAFTEHLDGTDRPVVLHVVEAWGGGVTTAVYEYVRSTPGYVHAILARQRTQHDTHDDSAPSAIIWADLPTGTLKAVRAISQTYRQLNPAVVHVHSSIAGVLARMCASIPTERIVYTPHCYAFERSDLPLGFKTAARITESVLAPRSGTVVACGRHELELAKRLRKPGKGHFAYVPNIVRVTPRTRAVAEAGKPLHIVGVGRLGAQKDPAFFRAVVAAVRVVDPSITWSWLGGDPASEETVMREAGIEVTGWIPRDELLDRLAAADVYLHTARWEGAPMSVLESSALGVPVVARSIPAVDAMGVALRGQTPLELAELILGLRSPAARDRASAASLTLAAENAPMAQVEALNAVYRDVSQRAGTSRSIDLRDAVVSLPLTVSSGDAA